VTAPAAPVTGGAPARLRPVRRGLRVGAVLAAGLLVAAALAWKFALPGYRPALHPGERFGVDVSEHQGAVDWRAAAGDGIGFAYLKATEGGDWVDGRFAENWRAAAEAGLPRGAYHFLTFCRPAAEQAEHFLRVVPRDPGALAPALDVEAGGNCAARLTPEVLEEEVRVWVERVEGSTGKAVVLYLLDDVEGAARVHRALGRPRWERSLLRRPSGTGWAMWQVSGWARVAGIAGPTDLNVGTTPA
jgi:lysozyme